MPKGPKGEKRPADVIGNAVRVREVATGQRDEEYADDPGKDKAAAKPGRKGGMDFREADRPRQALREARPRRPYKGPRSVSPSRAASTPVERNLSFQTAANRLAACRDPAC